MGSLRRTSSLVHDPLGLLALPMTPMAGDHSDDGPQIGTEGGEPSGMPIAAKTIGGAMVAALVAVSLVALPGPANDAQNSSRVAVWKADEGLCLGGLGPLMSPVHHPLRDHFDPQSMVRH